ncbi:hypothetical protein GYMLUDRAFT_250323 [Collybiopsis luxurians FD-317 M1]|uniref:Unplaced genomic scaffold GYMLUscaffold_80, whole genome shotgun sequence n=1 Tax=Collybiopsis luxurians FD-317 M1 TaxID=944289 RepID=A0A0D0CF02_9AGAR|nr:hypothetical protein GYMLUDRAFT_250323 [Collybiopsis luxurians FD-317 M1]
MVDYPLTLSKHHKESRMSTEATRVFRKVQEVQNGLLPDEAWLNGSNYTEEHAVQLKNAKLARVEWEETAQGYKCSQLQPIYGKHHSLQLPSKIDKHFLMPLEEEKPHQIHEDGVSYEFQPIKEMVDLHNPPEGWKVSTKDIRQTLQHAIDQLMTKSSLNNSNLLEAEKFWECFRRDQGYTVLVHIVYMNIMKEEPPISPQFGERGTQAMIPSAMEQHEIDEDIHLQGEVCPAFQGELVEYPSGPQDTEVSQGVGTLSAQIPYYGNSEYQAVANDVPNRNNAKEVSALWKHNLSYTTNMRPHNEQSNQTEPDLGRRIWLNQASFVPGGNTFHG